MQTRKIIAAVAAILLTAVAAQAAITIETVTVGNPGNAADTRYGIYGAVAYTYNIGKYEVTAGQYTAFLNAVAKTDAYGLYNTGMDTGVSAVGCNIKRTGSSGNYTYSVASDWASRPVNYVSFWDSCRFANWLANGQPTGAQGAGTTETGTYTLNGYNGDDGRTIQRDPGATWAVTSEDEWYKAAYYKGGSTNAGYWDYPTGSDTVPGQDLADVSGNNAVFSDWWGRYPIPIEPGHYTTVAGEFQSSDSPYGTFDQGGNVWEWNEEVVYEYEYSSVRGARGGSFLSYDDRLLPLRRVCDFPYGPAGEGDEMGFRIVEVPEPATLSLLAFLAVSLPKRGGLAAWTRKH